MAIYKGKDRITDIEAQTIGEALERLGTKFSPYDVVNAATHAKSPLHKYFEWQDDKAAAAHRLSQARWLIEHVSIVVSIDGNKTETRAFHSVNVRVQETQKVEPRYVPLRTVRQSANMREQVIARALKELNGWSRRYRTYQAVLGSGLFEEIDAVLERLA